MAKNDLVDKHISTTHPFSFSPGPTVFAEGPRSLRPELGESHRHYKPFIILVGFLSVISCLLLFDGSWLRYTHVGLLLTEGVARSRVVLRLRKSMDCMSNVPCVR